MTVKEISNIFGLILCIFFASLVQGANDFDAWRFLNLYSKMSFSIQVHWQL